MNKMPKKRKQEKEKEKKKTIYLKPGKAVVHEMWC